MQPDADVKELKTLLCVPGKVVSKRAMKGAREVMKVVNEK